MSEICTGNPFSHRHHRRVSRPGSSKPMGCDWCGQKPRVLYNYDYAQHWFCNKTCQQSCHG
jgi:hypothetical protein